MTVDRRGNHHWPPGDRRGGQFAPKAGGPAQPVKQTTPRAPARPRKANPPTPNGPSWAQTRKRLAQATDVQLADAWRDISIMAPSPAQARALAELDAELARREGVAELTVRDDPHSRALDRLVAKGYTFAEAWAEVNHYDEDVSEQERYDEVERNRRLWKTGRRETLRRMYREHVYLQYMDAEAATQGQLTTPAGRAKGIRPIELWWANQAYARKWASDELKAWWQDHGGRDNYAIWSSRYTGNRAAARNARSAGNGKDFGV